MTLREVLHAARHRLRLTDQEQETVRYMEWADHDPEAALREAMNIADPDRRRWIVSEILHAFVETNPPMGLEAGFASGVLKKGEWSGLVGSLFQALRLRDHAEAVEALRHWESRLESPRRIFNAAVETLEHWPEEDASGRFRAGAEFAAWFADDHVMMGVLLDGSAPTLEDVTWAATLEIEEVRHAALESAVYSADGVVAERALSLLPSEQRVRAALRKAGANPTDLLTVIASDAGARLEPREVSDAIRSLRFPTEMAFPDGTLIARVPEEYQEAVLHEVGWRVGRLEDKLRVLEDLPTSDLRATMGASLAGWWYRNDAAAALEWVDGIAEPPVRDAAVAEVVRLVAEGDPSVAAEWAATLNDPDLRERFQRVAFRHWSVANPESAAAAIAESALPDTAKASLLERIPHEQP